MLKHLLTCLCDHHSVIISSSYLLNFWDYFNKLNIRVILLLINYYQKQERKPFFFFFFLLHNYHNSKKFFPIFLPIYWLRKNSIWKRQKSNLYIPILPNIPSASTDSRSSCIPCQLTRTLTCQCRFTRRCAFLFVGTTSRRKMQSKDMRNSFRENREHYLASDVRSLYRANVTLEPPLLCLDRVALDFAPLSFFILPLSLFLFFCLVIFPWLIKTFEFSHLAETKFV